MRIGTSLKQGVEQVYASIFKGLVQRAVPLAIRIVAVRQQQKDQAVVAVLHRDLERRAPASPAGWPLLVELERASVADPSLNPVQLFGTAHLSEFLKSVGIRGGTLRRDVLAGGRVDPGATTFVAVV